jgi:hypothetical protein
MSTLYDLNSEGSHEYSTDDGSIKEEFHKHFWKYAIGGIIVALIGVMVYKIIGVLLNNPITKAVNKLAGAAALFLEDFTKGCCSQDSCGETTIDECNSSCGCAWDDNNTKCVNTTGNAEGKGGPFTLGCPLFFTAIAGLIAFSVLRIGAFIGKLVLNRKNTAADDKAQLDGKPADFKKWRKDIAVDESRLKKSDKYKDMTENEKDYALTRVTETQWNISFVEPLKEDPSQDMFNRQKDLAIANRSKSMENYDIDDDAADSIDRDIEDATETKDPINYPKE